MPDYTPLLRLPVYRPDGVEVGYLELPLVFNTFGSTDVHSETFNYRNGKFVNTNPDYDYGNHAMTRQEEIDVHEANQQASSFYQRMFGTEII